MQGLDFLFENKSYMIYTGKIMWIRAMVMQLETSTKEFAAHPKLRELPQYKVLVREYNSFAMEAATFEIKFLRRWEKACKVRY